MSLLSEKLDQLIDSHRQLEKDKAERLRQVAEEFASQIQSILYEGLFSDAKNFLERSKQFVPLIGTSVCLTPNEQSAFSQLGGQSLAESTDG